MNRVIKIITVYAMWIVDLALALVLMLISRTLFLHIFALFYQSGNLVFAHKLEFADKFFSIIIGLIWLAFSIFSEVYFRTNALKEGPLKLFSRVTGPLLLCIFIVDLTLSWLQGIGSGGWIRWLILAAELGIGSALLVYANLKQKQTALPQN